MRKLMYGALALGAAMAVSFGAGAVDASAAVTPTTTKVAQDGDILTFTKESAKVILVGQAKVKGGKLSVASWDTYEGAKATVDISKYSSKKDTIIMFKGDSDTDEQAVAAIIPASETIKVKYEKKDGSLKVTKTGQASGNYTGKLKFRTDSSQTFTLKNDIGETGTLTTLLPAGDGAPDYLPAYKMSGASVYFSVPYEAITTAKSSSDATASIEGTTQKGILLNARSGKEVKVTIGKLANAPKVKISYSKGTITVPKGVSYRKYKASETAPAFANAADKIDLEVTQKTESLAATEINGTADYAVDVQTPAADGVKPASKIGHYGFPQQTKTTDGMTGDSDAKKLSNTFTSVVSSDKSGKVNLTVKSSDNTNSYFIHYTKSGANKLVSAKLAPGKELKLSGLAEGKAVQIQRMGDDKKQIMAGEKLDLVSASEVAKRYAVIVDKSAKDLVTKIEGKLSGAEGAAAQQVSSDEYVILKDAVIYVNSTEYTYKVNGVSKTPSEGKISISGALTGNQTITAEKKES